MLNAARSLGDKSVNAQSVSTLVFEKLVSALRRVAATKDLVEIHAQRDAVARAVQRLVEVERQAPEHRQTYSEAALKFEIEEMRLEAQRDVQVELARAIGEFMSRGNMNIFGDSETLARMTEQYAKGLGVGMALAGALSGLGTGGDGKLSEMAQQLMQIAQRIGAVRIPDQNNSSTEQSASTDGDGSPQHSA